MGLLSKSLVALLATATTTVHAANYTEWMAESFLSKAVSHSRNYAWGVLYTGIELAYNKTSNPEYKSFIQAQIDGVVDSEGGLLNYPSDKISVDDLRIGLNLLWLWTETGDERYKIAADTLRHQIDITPRNQDGGLWHRMPTYPNQMWLDGIFMTTNFYALYTAWFEPNNATAWDDILNQFDLIEEHCLLKSGLLVHGYDASGVAVWADPKTGGAPHVWNRALGWYFMSLVDILDYFPQSHKGWKRNLNRFKDLARALKKAQDPDSGNWYLIMDEPLPQDPRNYIESSGSAMFTYGWLKGMRKGYLKKKDYGGVSEKAYKALVEDFVSHNANGTLNWEGTVEVGSLSSNGSFEYYISVPLQQNDFKGAGPFIYASYEMEAF